MMIMMMTMMMMMMLLYSVENMVSNDVLEWGLGEVEKQILTFQRQKKEVPEELITKKQQIELKLQLLIIQIQSGQVSEEDYIAMVEKKVVEEKAMARKYVQRGIKEAAQLCLLRAKIMAKELEGGEEEE
jgi:hypothetical protein